MAGEPYAAKVAGATIARSEHAMILQEEKGGKSYPPVVYFPREDVSMEYMSRTDRHTECPYKGEASYYSLLMDGEFAENAVWTYEEPYPAMSVIANRLAFYPDKVEVYEVDEATVNARRAEPRAEDRAAPPRDRGPNVDEVVQHTDTGAGHAQREHWPSNVETPGEEGGVR